MYDWEPAPIDSYDLYAMGLRAPRCNGCRYNELKHELGDKFHAATRANGWVDVYELDAEPEPGQTVTKIDGRSARCRAGFMSIQHSDECYQWKPLKLRQKPPHRTLTPMKGPEAPSANSIRSRIARFLHWLGNEVYNVSQFHAAGTWVTADGEVLEPKDIGDSHLRNIKRCLERRNTAGIHPFWPYLQAELARREKRKGGS